MKRIASIMVMLGISAWGFTQSSSKPATQNPPAAQSTPATGQTATPTAPQGKRAPAAKTQPEFEAYKAAMAITDPAAQEKAADDFATKYPDSELRVVLYKQGPMHAYQRTNNSEKTMEMARKVLALDPDDPEALVIVAQIVVQTTRDTDLDRDQRMAEAKKDAEHALTTVDTDIPAGGDTPERIAAFKGLVRSDAYDILGKLAMNSKSWAEAETNLRKSVDAYPEADPSTLVNLAVALDMQSKYPEALKVANQAVELSKEDTAVGKAARSERDRLTEMNKGAAPK
jgi:tetratricopeptide (TPR) repeat protein